MILDFRFVIYDLQRYLLQDIYDLISNVISLSV